MNGSFPGFRPYKDTGRFKFWCNKVLPTVYDDSLSYYEVLNKMATYLNDALENLETMEDNLETLASTVSGDTTAITNLQNSVSQITQEVTILRNTVEGFDDTIDEIEDNINNLSGAISSISGEIEGINSQITILLDRTDVLDLSEALVEDGKYVFLAEAQDLETEHPSYAFNWRPLELPTADGTYNLQITVDDGVITLDWVSVI